MWNLGPWVWGHTHSYRQVVGNCSTWTRESTVAFWFGAMVSISAITPHIPLLCIMNWVILFFMYAFQHALFCDFLFLWAAAAAAAAKSLQSRPTPRNPRDGSPPGSPIPGILQARALEWGAIAFSSSWKWNIKVKSLSRVWLLATPWTAAYQAHSSIGFSRQEYWSGVPLPSPSYGLLIIYYYYFLIPKTFCIGV